MITTNVAYSHLEFTGTLADLLVDAGHDVDFVIPMWNRRVMNNGTKKANVIRFYGKHLNNSEEETKKSNVLMDVFDLDITSADTDAFNDVHVLNCDGIISDKEFIETLKLRKYNVGMAEFHDQCSFSLFRVLGISSVHEISACPLMDNTITGHRLPVDINHIPMFVNYRQSIPVNTMFERIVNIYEYIKTVYQMVPRHRGLIEETFQRHGYDIPPVEDIVSDVSFVWVNTFEVVDFPRSTSPKIKNIGGIAVRSPSPLDDEMTALVDSAKDGIVLVSFGSIVDTTHLKASRRDILLSAFASFSHLTFVWKVSRLDSELMAAAGRIAPNVRLVEWMPQSSLLSHPKTVAFITHMGLNSLNEAAVAGVPMVGVPFFGDQQLNSAMAVRRGIARFVDRRSLSVESLREALAAVLTDPKYREASNDVKQKIKAAPFSPKDVFVKTVEFAAKFKSFEEFSLPYDPFYRRFQLDIIATFAALALVIGLMIRMLIRCVFGQRIHSAEETKKSK